MLKLIFLTMLLFATPAFAADADKVSHFGTGAFWGLAFGSVTYHVAEQMTPLERLATSTGLAILPGLAVEISDGQSANNGFSWGDVAADGLGALTGALTAELVNGQFWLAASGKQIRLVGKW